MDSSGPVGKAIKELIQGHESAKQLRSILRDARSLAATKDLANKISRSFENAISIILDGHGAGDQVSKTPANSLTRSPFSVGWKSKDSGKFTKSFAVKYRRSWYNRRNKGQTWTKHTPTSVADHYKWKKYGQKEIVNCLHPRSYYRCAHKDDRGCEATKQVQQIQNNPAEMYRTIYHGHHTCQNPIKKPLHVIIDSCDDLRENNSNAINFGSSSTSPNTKPQEPCFPTISFINQQENEGKMSSLNYQLQNQELLLEYNLQSSQLNNGGGSVTMGFESSQFGSVLSWTADNGDLISSGVNPSSMASTYNQGLVL
ncbi:WRKY DNA-binding transcription factor 70-like [Diospyros lotus]|uniref:WRKY DNA-binding transcription factor 70-like n=1 Tax=Diospyros lotus TaxID=55363 RepID=UPI0022594CB2|nr:WRKY DNA-binding transcription factor 70-like [Diospyros lotus]